jgi:hypothetical protein
VAACGNPEVKTLASCQFSHSIVAAWLPASMGCGSSSAAPAPALPPGPAVKGQQAAAPVGTERMATVGAAMPASRGLVSALDEPHVARWNGGNVVAADADDKPTQHTGPRFFDEVNSKPSAAQSVADVSASLAASRAVPPLLLLPASCPPPPPPSPISLSAVSAPVTVIRMQSLAQAVAAAAAVEREPDVAPHQLTAAVQLASRRIRSRSSRLHCAERQFAITLDDCAVMPGRAAHLPGRSGGRARSKRRRTLRPRPLANTARVLARRHSKGNRPSVDPVTTAWARR